MIEIDGGLECRSGCLAGSAGIPGPQLDEGQPYEANSLRVLGVQRQMLVAAGYVIGFDSATEITGLPISTTIDTTGATKASDDPSPCNYQSYSSVWLRYTAPADGLVKLTSKSDRYATFYGVYTGTRGSLTAVPGACTTPGVQEKTFHVTTGTTYFVEVVEHVLDDRRYLEAVAGKLGRLRDRFGQTVAIGRDEEEQALRELGQERLVFGDAVDEVRADRQHDAQRARRVVGD